MLYPIELGVPVPDGKAYFSESVLPFKVFRKLDLNLFTSSCAEFSRSRCRIQDFCGLLTHLYQRFLIFTGPDLETLQSCQWFHVSIEKGSVRENRACKIIY
tara:strand:- start:24549 stop:24851 length:303 start_codon:yes stop_codon:yes gene_type:complete